MFMLDSDCLAARGTDPSGLSVTCSEKDLSRRQLCERKPVGPPCLGLGIFLKLRQDLQLQ